MKLKCENLIGQTFFRLKVLEFSHGDTRAHWKCVCVCGNITLTTTQNLKRGSTKSCGCFSRETLSARRKNNNPNWSGVGDMPGEYVNSLKKSARKRKIKFDISKEYMWNLYEQQDGKCAISGLPIKFWTHSKMRDGTASIDRIDSAKGYIEGNVQWVCKDINFMKQSLEQGLFINYCKIIADFQSTK